MMMYAFMRFAGDPEQIDLLGRFDRHWGYAMYMTRSKSFDIIVRFFAGFLCDEEPADPIAPLPAIRLSSSASTADESHELNPSDSPGMRKRSLIPATVDDDDDDDDDQDEARPTKKTRFANGMIEPRAASLSSPRPISPGAARVRKWHPPSIPQSSRSAVPAAIMAPSPPPTSAGSDSVSTPPQTHARHSGQHTDSGLVYPDEEDQGNNNTRKRRDMGPAVGLSASPRTKNSSRDNNTAGLYQYRGDVSDSLLSTARAERARGRVLLRAGSTRQGAFSGSITVAVQASVWSQVFISLPNICSRQS